MASGKTAILAVKIVSQAKGAADGFNKTATAGDKFARGMRIAKVAAAATLGAIVLLGKKAFDAASKLQQSAGGMTEVFKNQAGAVQANAKKAADSVGMSQSAYLDMATDVGSVLKSTGVSQDKLAGSTDNLIRRGKDLATAYGVDSTEAVKALTRAEQGRYRRINDLGVTIDKTTVAEKLAANGQDKLTGTAKKTAEAHAAMSIIMDKTKDKAGAYGRAAGDAASVQEKFAAKAENMKASLGTALLPVVAGLAKEFGKMADFVDKNTTAVQIIIGVVAGLAAGILLVNVAMAAWRAAVVVATAVQWAWNVALDDNPIGIIILAITALVAAVIYCWTHFKTFRVIVVAALNAITWPIQLIIKGINKAVQKVGGWHAIWKALKTAVVAYLLLITYPIRKVISWINKAVQKVGGWSNVWRAFKRVGKASLHAILHPIDTIKTFIARVQAKVNNAGGTFGRFRDRAAAAVHAILHPIQTLKAMIDRVLGALARIHFPSVPGWMSNGLSAINPFSRMATPGGPAAGMARAMAAPAGVVRPMTAPAGPSFADLARIGQPAAAGPTGGGMTVNVTVNGAVDKDGTARQISKLLADYDRRTGKRMAGR